MSTDQPDKPASDLDLDIDLDKIVVDSMIDNPVNMESFEAALPVTSGSDASDMSSDNNSSEILKTSSPSMSSTGTPLSSPGDSQMGRSGDSRIPRPGDSQMGSRPSSGDSKGPSSTPGKVRSTSATGIVRIPSSTGARKNNASGARPAIPDSMRVPRTTSSDAGVDLKAADKWTGKLLGKFKLSKMIGHGGMGVVFQAKDLHLKRVCALKVLRKDIKKGPNDRVELFLREARAVAALDDPYIVQIYEISNVQGWWYIAMEFLEGGSIQQLIKTKGPLDPAVAAQYTADAARGLGEAHANGIIHRDIKPANLMIVRRGHCKVADFGLVRFEDPNDPSMLNHITVGTPLYAAPEIIRHKGATSASDVYALGATLYYMITGHAPYRAKTTKEIFRMHLKAEVPDIREEVPAVSKKLAKLIAMTLSKDPAERPTTMALALALETEIMSKSTAGGFSAFMSSGSGLLGLGNSRSEQSRIMNTSRAGSVSSRSMAGVKLPPPSVTTPTARPVTPPPMNRVVVAGALAGVFVLGTVFGAIVSSFFRSPEPQTEAMIAKPETPTQSAEELAAIKEASRFQARVSAQWLKLQKIDPGQGVGEMIDTAKANKIKADDAFRFHDYVQATQGYEALETSLRDIESADKSRQKALEARETYDHLLAKVTGSPTTTQPDSTTTSSQVFKAQVDPDSGNADTARFIESAEAFRTDAAREFDAGRFDYAAVNWKLATDHLKKIASAHGETGVREP